MPTPFQTLLIVGFALCISHLITGYFKSLIATAVLILYLAALVVLVIVIITFQWHTINFNHQRQFFRLRAETERMERGSDSTQSFCMAQKTYDRNYARTPVRSLATMDLMSMMILAVWIHFFRDPTATGWLVVVYCLYWDIRGIRIWLLRLAAEYMDPAV
ncbi:hypothetical protein KCU78_g5001, partial [Aureobasidium melanogenum]